MPLRLKLVLFLGFFCLLTIDQHFAVADSCQNADAPLSKAICADKDAITKNTAMLAAYRSALGRLSAIGKAILKKSQDHWDVRVTETCILFPTQLKRVLPDEDPDPTGCVSYELQNRIEFLQSQGAKVGAFVWQQVDQTLDLYCFSGEDISGRNLVQLAWTWPRIDRPSTAASDKWNEAHRVSGKDVATDSSSDPCDIGGYHHRNSKPVFGQGGFVNIVYEEDWSGLNHGVYAHRSTLELISTGKLLQATDFFRANSGWRDFVAERIFTAAGGDDGGHSKANFEAYAEDIGHWTVDAKTLTYNFDPYELGGYLSAMQVSFTWKELRPYLRNDLPFHPDFN